MAMIAAFKASGISRALGFKIYVPGRSRWSASGYVKRARGEALNLCWTGRQEGGKRETPSRESERLVFLS